jgi:hypothetical protein
MSVDVRLIAFYLPQFHPIPENDEWWGPGFTEWSNVTRGRPMFDGHYQPRRPGELGYYDLRVKEVRHRQVALARKYGVYGFCYYYYWFSGQRLLQRPLDLVLEDPELDFPLCICWANENWSRRWDGSEHDVLMEQKYTQDDPDTFIRDIAPILKDRRYITVDGAPIVLVYRAAVIPDVARVLGRWRAAADRLGISRLHLCSVQSFGYREGFEHGFDAMVEFPPHSIALPTINGELATVPAFRGNVYSYDAVVEASLHAGTCTGVPIYRGLMVGWDNTARRGETAHIFHESTPEGYEVWLRRLVDFTRRHHTGDQRMIFVNAWNEWAEGAYLEPDERYGHGYLEATARALFDVLEPFGLIRTLKQITAGNQEAQGLLDNLHHALRVNERIMGLIDTKRLVHSPASSDQARARFRPAARSGVTLPSTIRTYGVFGRLDMPNVPSAPRADSVLAINRSYDVLFAGWIVALWSRPNANSPIIFQLTNMEGGECYLARVSSRVRRDDVVNHLNGRLRWLPYNDRLSRYSGYHAYFNLTDVEPGLYKLDAIVTTDNKRGTKITVHPRLQLS